MSDYTPDRWILIRVESKEGEILYKNAAMIELNIESPRNSSRS